MVSMDGQATRQSRPVDRFRNRGRLRGHGVTRPGGRRTEEGLLPELKVGQGALRPHSKILLVVPCSNPNHSLETYAVLHGGWGSAAPSHSALIRIATSVCRGSFQRRFGHPIRAGDGFEFFFADPGAETTKYGDRVNCGLRLWPSYGAMGAGTHTR